MWLAVRNIHGQLPISTLLLLLLLLLTSRGKARMMVSVVMSSATRVPLVSFALSTFVRHPTT
jgi:hypothetical protein